jgi:Tol biopolymer transport system component
VPAIAPTEKAVAFTRIRIAGADIWTWEMARSNETRVTTAGGRNIAATWSPAADRIAFTQVRVVESQTSLRARAASGAGQDEVLLTVAGVGTALEQWSRDGKFLVYHTTDSTTKQDLWVLPLSEPASERKPVPFLRSDFNQLHGQLSPDSRWMAYTSDESGQREVYVRPFPAGDQQWKISTGGGEQPRWRGDGKEMFYVALDGKMMTVPIRAASAPTFSFEPAIPVPLFQSHIAAPDGVLNTFQYDVTADGKRFLIVTTGPASGGPSPPLVTVVNWNAGLGK